MSFCFSRERRTFFVLQRLTVSSTATRWHKQERWSSCFKDALNSMWIVDFLHRHRVLSHLVLAEPNITPMVNGVKSCQPMTDQALKTKMLELCGGHH